MPQTTSEGWENTGLAPNPKVDKDELEPEKFDQQTAEIFLNRLNKALGAPERTTLTDALLMVTTLRSERDQFRTALQTAWAYFHERIGGLKCGLGGTWQQALDELTTYIKSWHIEIRTLKEQAVKLSAEKGASISVDKMIVTSQPAPELAPPVSGTLTTTDRALLVEAIPGLITRIERLEKVAFSVASTPS